MGFPIAICQLPKHPIFGAPYSTSPTCEDIKIVSYIAIIFRFMASYQYVFLKQRISRNITENIFIVILFLFDFLNSLYVAKIEKEMA